MCFCLLSTGSVRVCAFGGYLFEVGLGPLFSHLHVFLLRDRPKMAVSLLVFSFKLTKNGRLPPKNRFSAWFPFGPTKHWGGGGGSP